MNETRKHNASQQSGRFTKIPKSMYDDRRLTGNDIIVYGAIDYHADNKGTAWPSIMTIAEKAHVSDSTVKRSLKILQDCGYIKKTRRRAKGSKEFDSSIYQVVFRLKGEIDTPILEGERSEEPGVTQNQPTVTQNQQVSSERPNNETHSNEILQNETNAKGLCHKEPGEAGPEATPETENRKDKNYDEANAVIGYFRYCYSFFLKKEHPPIVGDANRQLMQSIIDQIGSVEKTGDIINEYFQSEYEQGCDYHFWHFANGRVWAYVGLNLGLINRTQYFEPDGMARNSEKFLTELD